jgi:hypothetical protein
VRRNMKDVVMRMVTRATIKTTIRRMRNV